MLPLMKSKIRYEEKHTDKFGGINVREDYTPGDICNELNMSSEMYPALCTRSPRKINTISQNTITGIGNCEGLIFSHSDSSGRMFLNYRNTDYEFTSVTTVDAGEKRDFAALSDCVLIIPDNIIFTPSTGTFKPVCVKQKGSSSLARIKFATESDDSDVLDNATKWYIGYVSHNALKCRTTNYIYNNVFCYFAFDPVLKSGDVVTLKLSVTSDMVHDEDAYYEYRQKMAKGITLKIKDVTVLSHRTAIGSMKETIELIFDDNSIDVGEYTDLVFNEITVERSMPDLKKICSFNNRIWGITEKELCCSKLGDASEWNDFSTDSYGTMPYACFSSPAPTEGDFTSIVSLGNYVYAFKENAIHKLYGDNPDEFELKTIETYGVPDSKSYTVAKGNSAIFYCSHNGVYRFDGNTTQCVSECLESSIDYMCAGSNSQYYYVLCLEEEQSYVYVYDIRRKIWHREDSQNGIKMLCRVEDNVYAATDNSLIMMNRVQRVTDANNPQWHFTLKFDEKQIEKMGFGKISFRYSLGKDAFFTVRTIYDDETKGAVCGAKHDEVFGGGGYMHMPVRRCRSFKIQFNGKGFFCLKSLMIKYYRGSEI